MPVIAGGVEASLRRIAHYDYWSDKAAAEQPDELEGGSRRVRKRRANDPDDRDSRLRQPASPSAICATCAASPTCWASNESSTQEPFSLGRNAWRHDPDWKIPRRHSRVRPGGVELPELRAGRRERFPGVSSPEATRLLPPRDQPAERATVHPDAAAIVPWSSIRHRFASREAEMDAAARAQPYLRKPAPAYDGGRQRSRPGAPSPTRSRSCAAASVAALSARSHCTRAARSRAAARSPSCAKCARLASEPGFKGHISDLGGPTANMYRMRCSQPARQRRSCRRLSCVSPKICKLLDTDHAPLDRAHAREPQGPSKGSRRSTSHPGSEWTSRATRRVYLDELVRAPRGRTPQGRARARQRHGAGQYMKKPRPVRASKSSPNAFRDASRSAQARTSFSSPTSSRVIREAGSRR